MLKLFCAGSTKNYQLGCGIGLSRERWLEIGRELIDSGYIEQDCSTYATLKLTQIGLAVLKNKSPILLSKSQEKVKSKTKVQGSHLMSRPLWSSSRSFDRLERNLLSNEMCQLLSFLVMRH